MRKGILLKEQLKLKMYGNNKVVVYNYEDVLDMTSEKIVLKKYIIEGDGLVVKKMDEYEIEIVGKFKTIKLV